MNIAFYLDDARWGLASASVQQAQIEFARLTGDPRGLLYFADFLAGGFDAWPDAMQSSYPTLCHWRGVARLSESLRRNTNASGPVAFASRTASLMQIAANDLSQRCRRVLTTDLLWQPYRDLLAQACRRRQAKLLVCRLRSDAFLPNASEASLGKKLAQTYLAAKCDGLVLPLIDHRGIALPVDSLVKSLRDAGRPPTRLIVDGSQAFAHVPIDLSSLKPDCFIAPAHKWLGGGHPLAMGVFSDRLDASLTQRCLRSDPLLRLTQEAARRIPPLHGETSPILPLITASTAFDSLSPQVVECRLAARLAQRRRLLGMLADMPAWKPLFLGLSPNGIALLRTQATTPAPSGQSRTLARCGVVATQYRNGLLRISTPANPIADWGRLHNAFHRSIGNDGRGMPSEATPP